MSGSNTITENRRHTGTRGAHVLLLAKIPAAYLLLNELYVDYNSSEYLAFEKKGWSPASTNVGQVKQKILKKLAAAKIMIAKQ